MYSLGIAQPLKYSYSADLLDLQRCNGTNFPWTLSTQKPGAKNCIGILKKSGNRHIKMAMIFFKFHAQPQTGAYSCLIHCMKWYPASEDKYILVYSLPSLDCYLKLFL